MPDIKFYCKSCGKKLGIDASAAGFMINCPGCGTENRVPLKTEDPPDSAFDPQRPTPPTRPTSPAPDQTATPAPPTDEFKKASAEYMKVLSERDELQQKLSLLEKEKEQWIAEKNSLAPQLNEHKRQLTEARELAKSISEKSAAAEKQHLDLKSKLDAAETQQRNQAEAHEKLRGELKLAQEKLSAASRESADINELQGRLSALEKEKVEWAEKFNALTAQLSDRDSRISESNALAKTASDRSDTLEKQILDLKKNAAALADERDKLILEQKNAGEKLAAAALEQEKLTSAKNTLSEEVAALRAEHKILMRQLEETKTLSSSMETMRAQISELQAQEKQLVKVIAETEAKASAPIAAAPAESRQHYRRPFPINDMNRKIAGIIGLLIAVTVCVLTAWWIWPESNRPPVIGDPSLQRGLDNSSGRQSMDLVFGTPVESDGMEITMLGARIAPITLVALSGLETVSEQRYLIVDVRLINRRKDRSVSLFRTWRDTRMIDLNGQVLPQAFTEALPLGEEIKGAANGKELAGGEETQDMIIFEWKDEKSPAFTLKTVPTFWQRTNTESFVPTSNLSISLNIPRESIVGR